MNIKKIRNRLRQKITVQVKNRPWRSFQVTLAGGFMAGLATHFFR